MPTDVDLLADLLDGRIDAADVPAELAELASLADQVRQHVPVISPDAAFRESLGEQVVQQATGAGGAAGAAGAGGAVTSAATAAGGGGLSAIVAGVAATAVLATGTVAAADRAGPGDLLAGLDRGIESLQLAIADDERDAELLAEFATERVVEAVGLLDAAVVDSLLDEADALLDQALALATQQGRDLTGLIDGYASALLDLAAQSDDALVDAQVVQRLRDAGIDPEGLELPTDGAAEDDDSLVGDELGEDPTEPVEDVADDPGDVDVEDPVGEELPADPTEGSVEDPADGVVDDPVDVPPVDDPLEDPVDVPVEDPVDEPAAEVPVDEAPVDEAPVDDVTDEPLGEVTEDAVEDAADAAGSVLGD